MISLKTAGGWTGGNQVPPGGGALAQLGPHSGSTTSVSLGMWSLCGASLCICHNS